MTGPRVSVVVPTHNRAGLLPALLAALDRQDYPAYDVVIADDASTDETPEILARWEGSDRRVVRTDRAVGSYGARNAGWRASSGEIVAFTDDDCLPAPGWISALVAALGSDMVGVQGETRAEPGEITPFTHQIDQSRPGPPYRTCNIAYRRTELERQGGFDDTFRWYADNIFGLRARLEGPIGFAPAAVVRHPPRPREWRDVAGWQARFDADARHRVILQALHAEPVSPPPRALPVILWVVRPLLNQSMFHLRYALRHPRVYLEGVRPMVREKVALLRAMRSYYRPAVPAAGSLSPLPERSLVSAIVVTRDRPHLLAGALSAVRGQSWERREIVVVDNAGDLDLQAPDVRVVRAPHATLGQARQRGVEAACGDVVAFTDDDCVPRSDWLESLVHALERNPQWLGVQGRTMPEAGPVGSHAIRVGRPGSLFQTSNMAYRRDVLNEAGGFDGDFSGWFEDTALAARVLERGPIGFAPDAVVVHRAMPRHPMQQGDWRRLIRDERLLARRYPVFYRRTRGPSPLVSIIGRWLLGSPIKTVMRELPRARQDPAAFSSLVRSLVQERIALIRALLDER